MGLFSSVKKAFKKVGQALKGTVGKVLGVVAAIAMPFIAPAVVGLLTASPFIASAVSAIGATAANTLVGAGLGAGLGALTGQGALAGAITGGIGGFMAPAGGAGSLFGGGGTAGATGGTALGAPAATTIAGPGGWTTSVIPAAGIAAPTALASTASSLLSSVRLGDLAPLAMTLFNKPPDQLTAEEKAYLDETAQAAATNEQIFQQRIADAQSIRAAGPTPEQAYQRTAEAIDVQAQDAARRAALTGSAGRSDFLSRQAAIARGTAGGLASAQAGQQQAENIRTAAGLMPTGAPTDETAASRLAIARGREKQQQDYLGNIGTSVGRLFGNMGESEDERLRRTRQSPVGLTVGDMYSTFFG